MVFAAISTSRSGRIRRDKDDEGKRREDGGRMRGKEGGDGMREDEGGGWR